MFELVVTLEFGAYAVGDRITEQDAMDAALSGHAGHVVRVLAEAPALTPPAPLVATEPDAPLPAPPAE